VISKKKRASPPEENLEERGIGGLCVDGKGTHTKNKEGGFMYQKRKK